jgi:threonyl-tRNA synthetase
MVTVRLPDGSTREYPDGTTARDVAESIGKKLAKDSAAARIDGEIRDISWPLHGEVDLELITRGNTDDALYVLRHSAAHVLATAVQNLYPAAKFGTGPATKDGMGFYYDIDFGQTLSSDDLPAIEKEMRRVIKQNHKFERFEKTPEEAKAWAKGTNQDYKVELIDRHAVEGETLSFYQDADFVDLCAGPHVPHTGWVKAVKLLRVTGAYWDNDESREQMTRIYGTAFYDNAAMEEYLHWLEEAGKRDHRKLGKELDLFSFHPESPASPFFHPKGAFIYNRLVDYVRGMYTEYGYDEIITPQILDVSLWHTSGHYENYKENMYFTNIDDREYAVKPMNCPMSTYVFNADIRSYRDLPLRYADFGRLHRYERSGVVAGLTRVRTFAQDDAHIYCTPDQVQEEISKLIQMYFTTFEVFGFDDVTIFLSTRPEKAIGEREQGDKAEQALKEALDGNNIAYEINEGDGAFYGPKIDFNIQDALKRKWQLSTIQLDFFMPERFDVNYITPEGTQERPVVIHRAMLGSIERFMGILIEHCGGAFPYWLAPVQVKILPVAEAQNDYAAEVRRALKERGIRAESDERNERISFKIREAETTKIPYMLVVGQKEVDAGTVSVRRHGEGDLGVMTVDDLVAQMAAREQSP